jgi:hypothetical protein
MFHEKSLSPMCVFAFEKTAGGHNAASTWICFSTIFIKDSGSLTAPVKPADSDIVENMLFLSLLMPAVARLASFFELFDHLSIFQRRA